MLNRFNSVSPLDFLLNMLHVLFFYNVYLLYFFIYILSFNFVNSD